jgi:NAD(P)H-hydrate epimerase
MKIFPGEQIRKIDHLTIANEPVSPADLMERAATSMFNWFISRFDRSTGVNIFAGPGNNGGDGLVLGRLLSLNRYNCVVWYVNISESNSDEWKINRERLDKETHCEFKIIDTINQFPIIAGNSVIIDSIFGSGLKHPPEGLAAEVIKEINSSEAIVVSVDIPSGLPGEDNSLLISENVVRADFTLSFQFPKLSFMFPENEIFTGEWIVLPIGLHPGAIESMYTPYTLTENEDIAPLLKKRDRFDHKGIFGHGLLVGGSYGKTGAVVLGSRAALRTGIGLITCHIPSCGNLIMQSSVPEAMLFNDTEENHISCVEKNSDYDAVAIGPGMGTHEETKKALYGLLWNCDKPLVIDADGLNILAMNNQWLQELPEGTVLTPHLKEFERLAGKCSGGYERLQKQIEFSVKYRCVVVLKGANTSVTSPDGQVAFNSTGNPGMATAGSGDVLTGMILSLLAQGYLPTDAAKIAVYLHGLAGDIASGSASMESVIASDIIDKIGEAWKRIKANVVRY